MKSFLVVALVLCGLAAAGYYWWIHSPVYAVQQASNAVKAHDINEFRSWVDVHHVASEAVEDLLAEPCRRDGTPLLQRVVGLAVVSFLKPAVVDGMTGQINTWIAHGPRQNDSGDAQDDDDDDYKESTRPPRTVLGQLVEIVKPPSLKQTFQEYGLTKKNYRGIGSVDSADQTAHVGLRFFSPKLQKEFQIKLALEQTDNRWRITKIANMQEVVNTLTGG